MAKTKVKKELAMAPEAPDYKPTLWLDLEGQDVVQVKELSVGEEVEVVVTGKVVGLEQRERQDSGDKTAKKTGSIRLENYRVRVMGEEDNVFTKMSKEDD
jgi:hypothetical protein